MNKRISIKIKKKDSGIYNNAISMHRKQQDIEKAKKDVFVWIIDFFSLHRISTIRPPSNGQIGNKFNKSNKS
ncbi:hypothetical protein RST01_16150 [Rummeliibacillus stabekisii]|nr:hypothetical protein RST01_16150 [Rummeliibacillus stabekisii]